MLNKLFKQIYWISAIILMLIMAMYSYNSKQRDEEKSFINNTQEVVDSSLTNVYFFYGKTCPHCHEEDKLLQKIANNKEANIHYYEVYFSEENRDKYTLVNDHLKAESTGVPFTIIGDKHWTGYGSEESTGKYLKDRIAYCNQNKCEDTVGKLLGIIKEDVNKQDTTENTEISKEPTEEDKNINVSIFGFKLGDFNVKSVSLPLAVFVIAAVDGFNPCAMWILIFLITLLIDMKNRVRMLILGGTFIFISGLIYFLILSGWGFLFNFLMPYSGVINLIITFVALVFGYNSLDKYINLEKNVCIIENNQKRVKIFDKLKNLVKQKSFIISILGISVLAFSVNVVELFCSIGLPVVYSGLLSDAGISGFGKYLYHAFYALVFLLDDLIVFIVAMVTLNISRINEKIDKPMKLIGGIVMIIIALYLYWSALKTLL